MQIQTSTIAKNNHLALNNKHKKNNTVFKARISPEEFLYQSKLIKEMFQYGISIDYNWKYSNTF